MNPCALWRCIGSDPPGGYSTVIIRPSLPGKSVRSFEKSGVTFASLASSVPDITQTGLSLTDPLVGARRRFRSGLSEPAFEACLAELRAIVGKECPLANLHA